MIRLIRNRRKAILGAIAFALTWAGLKLGLELDADTATLIAGAIFTAVVERAKPIFGVDVDGPGLQPDSRVRGEDAVVVKTGPLAPPVLERDKRL